MAERIQKILSQWGVASRRHAEELILQGRVRLNGTVVKLGEKADTSRFYCQCSIAPNLAGSLCHHG